MVRAMLPNLSRTAFAAVALVALQSACVPKSRFDLAVKTGAEAESAAQAARAEVTALSTKLDAAQKDNADKSAKLVTYEEQTYSDSRRLAELEKQLTTLGNTNTEVGERLRMASKTLTELANERKTLTTAVNDTRACIDALQTARTKAATAKPATKAPPEPSPELAEFERCVRQALLPTTPLGAPTGTPVAPPTVTPPTKPPPPPKVG